MLRLASRDTKTLPIGDDGEIIVKNAISKRDFNRLLSLFPDTVDGERGFTPGEAVEYTAGLFEVFVTGWNATDLDGNPVAATRENYLDLDRDGASAIDAALIDHFNSLTPTETERKKS